MLQLDDNTEFGLAALHSTKNEAFYNNTDPTPPGVMEEQIIGQQIQADGSTRPVSGTLKVTEWIKSQIAYAPYLARQDSELRELRAGEALPLGDDFPYDAIPGLSREMIERVSRARPATLAAAGRVAGITPAALAALLVHARRRSGESGLAA